MNRDPKGTDCTRDPIFLLQRCSYQWTEFPSGIDHDGESFVVEDEEELEDWIKPFIDDGVVQRTKEFYKVALEVENEHGWPLIYKEWSTESVFLTRAEGEDWGNSRSYRFPDGWRVYCVPSEGELAEALNAYQPSLTAST